MDRERYGVVVPLWYERATDLYGIGGRGRVDTAYEARISDPQVLDAVALRSSQEAFDLASRRCGR
jgi:hypothetical protein